MRRAWTPAEEEALRTNWRGPGEVNCAATMNTLVRLGFGGRTARSLRMKAHHMGLKPKQGQGLISLAEFMKFHGVAKRDRQIFAQGAKQRRLVKHMGGRLFFDPKHEAAMLQLVADMAAPKITTKRAGRDLGVSPLTILGYLRQGLLKGFLLGPRCALVDPQSLAELVAVKRRQENLVRAGVLLGADAIRSRSGRGKSIVYAALAGGGLAAERLWWPGQKAKNWWARREDVDAWVSAGFPLVPATQEGNA